MKLFVGIPKMKTKWAKIIGVLLILSGVVFCYGAWDNTKPGDNQAWNDAAGSIRDNWDAIETGFFTGSISVKIYGAVGDDSTDDTTAIRAAETAAAAADMAVYFPPGTYKITGALTAAARAYIGDGGDGTKTVIKQYTADTAIFEYSNINRKRFEGLSFDAAANGVYAFKQTTVDAYTNYCMWKDCHFSRDIARCIHANLIFATFDNVKFGWDGTVRNNIHTAIFSHGTTARNTNVNTFFKCLFDGGKGGNGYIDISLGIGWQFYSCTYGVMNVAAVYAKDVYSLSFPNCYFEQRIDLGSGQNYLIYLGADLGVHDVTMFSGIFLSLIDNTDIDHFIELGNSNNKVAFGKGGMMKLGNKNLTNYSGTANYGIESIDGVIFVGFDDQAKRHGFFQTGNILLRAIEASPNTLVQSIDFENTAWDKYANAPFASIQVHTSDTGVADHDSSEMTFHTLENETNGMKERLRIDSIGMLHNKQDTGDVVLFTHQEDSLADDGSVSLPDATSGMVFVSCNAEAGMWLVQSDGTVTKISGSTNTAATDSDTDLCVFDGGANQAVVKNRLGATGEIRIFYYHN